MEQNNQKSLYHLMLEYAMERRIPKEEESPTPELGSSLSLFHSCLIDAELSHFENEDGPRLTALPPELHPTHISHFLVSFLPFNSVSKMDDINIILFDVYSFLSWLQKCGIEHGLESTDFQQAVRNLSTDQERCLKLSHMLDKETGKILDDPPEIMETLSGWFSVDKKDGSFVFLKSKYRPETIRLRLPEKILSLIESRDILDLVLGDTSDRWVLLEAGQVFPEYEPT